MSTEPPKYGRAPLPSDDWETRLTKQVARSIAFYKDEAGWTTAELAERCSQVVGETGAFKTQTVTNLLAGKRRSVTVAEVLIFADALKVPPLALLVPLRERGEVEALPGRTMSPLAFLASIGGETGLTIFDLPAEQETEPTRTRTALMRAHFHWAEAVDIVGQLNWLTIAPRIESIPAAVLEARRYGLAHAVTNLRESRDWFVARGIEPPALPPDLAWIERVGPQDISGELLEQLARGGGIRDAEA